MLLHWPLAFSLAQCEEEDTMTVKIIPNDKATLRENWLMPSCTSPTDRSKG